jgi:hypothetical protein
VGNNNLIKRRNKMIEMIETTGQVVGMVVFYGMLILPMAGAIILNVIQSVRTLTLKEV